MKAFLEILRTRHGSIEGYLRGLGVKNERLDTLQEHILEA